MTDRLNGNSELNSFSGAINESIEDFNTFELSDEEINENRIDNQIGSITTSANGVTNKKPPNTALDNKDLRLGSQYCLQRQ